MKILIWDLETAGMNSFKPDLAAVVNFGWKWLGEKRAHCITVDQFPGWFSARRPNTIDDRPLLRAGLEIMEQADLLVAHFGDKFDRRFFQGRCAMHDLTPPPPTKQRDTWRIAKTAFNFSSNRLVHLAITLGLKERKHEKERDEWPGWWLRTLAGDPWAIHEMAKYCKQDVQTLEQVYLRVRQYDNPHPRMVDDRGSCRLCGGDIQYRGVSYAGERKYRRFQCRECGRWDRERKAIE